jgi:hypothetical protein
VIFMPAFLSRTGAQPAFSSPIDATGRSVMGHHGNVTFNALVHIEHLEATGNIVELWQSAQTARTASMPSCSGSRKRATPDEVPALRRLRLGLREPPDQALTVPQLYQDMCKRRTQAGQRFDRRRIRGLTMPPVHRFSPTRRANLTLPARRSAEIGCYYWSA